MSRFNKGGAKPDPAPAKPAAPAPAKAADASKTEPVFEELLPEKQEAVELSGVRFPVKIKGVKASDVKWTFEGDALDIDNNPNIEYEVDEDTGCFCLTITEASYPEDCGVYRCTAKNEGGETYSECNLLLEEMPEHVKAALAQYSHKK